MRAATARGQIKAKALTLSRMDEMSLGVTVPNNLASQLALLTGDLEKSVKFEVEGGFSFAEGAMRASAMRTTIGDTTSMITGATDLESGVIDMVATMLSAPTITSRLQGKDAAGRIGIAIGGTVRQPVLDVMNLKGELSSESVASLTEGINDQITRMRAKESQRLMQKSQNEVDEILRPLRGPATLPAGGGRK
jgi:hypothetical protein